MKRSRILAMSAVGAVCALGGAAAGIAESSASSPKAPSRLGFPLAALRAARVHGPLVGGGIAFALGPIKAAAGPPVHSEAVVPNEKGGFDTVTMDRGSFVSLSGDQLTIKEGTSSATYKQPTLTIPADATVRRNDEKAQLSDLKAGDTVLVLQSPEGTVVAAHDAQHEADLKELKRRFLKPGPPGGSKLEGGPKVGAAAPAPLAPGAGAPEEEGAS